MNETATVEKGRKLEMTDQTQGGNRKITVKTGDHSQAAVAGGDQENVTLQMISAGQREDVDKLLAHLRKVVDDNEAKLADPETVRVQTAMVEDELRREQPEPGMVKGLLARIRDGAGNVAAIVDVVERLQHAIGALV